MLLCYCDIGLTLTLRLEKRPPGCALLKSHRTDLTTHATCHQPCIHHKSFIDGHLCLIERFPMSQPFRRRQLTTKLTFVWSSAVEPKKFASSTTPAFMHCRVFLDSLCRYSTTAGRFTCVCSSEISFCPAVQWNGPSSRQKHLKLEPLRLGGRVKGRHGDCRLLWRLTCTLLWWCHMHRRVYICGHGYRGPRNVGRRLEFWAHTCKHAYMP